MKPEDKKLLLQDLCARLLYEPMVWFKENWETNPNFEGCVSALRLYHLEYIIKDMDITLKPYLRPMSSMTEEERYEYDSFFNLDYGYMDAGAVFDVADWINAHHFDFRGLIEKGLALEAPEYMYMHLKT